MDSALSLTDDTPRPRKKKRQVRRKGNVRTWAKWTLRQAIVRTYNLMGIERPKGRVSPRRFLGYDHIDLVASLESQFEDGMSWEVIDQIHIDHVIPIKWFIEHGITNVAIINDISNLKPIWAKDNLRKGADLPPDFEQRLAFLVDKYRG